MIKAATALAAALFLPLAAGFDWQHHLLTRLPSAPVDCPSNAPAIIVFGQSDGANTGDRRRIGPKGSYMFADGRCFRLKDPVRGGTDGGGSIWPALAAHLRRPVVFINQSVSGAAIAELSGAPLAELRATIAAAKARGIRPTYTIFLQGDTDVVRHTSADAYLVKLRELRSALPGRWIIPEGAFCTPGVSQSALGIARRQLAATDLLVKVGPDLDVLGLEYRRADRCHFNRRGQDRIALMLARDIRLQHAQDRASEH